MAGISKAEIKKAIKAHFGESESKSIFAKYENAFNANYYADTPIAKMMSDIEHLEKLSNDKPFEIDLYKLDQKLGNFFRLRLFQYENPMPLSDILPILENLNLRTLNEHPYALNYDDTIAWISDFNVEYVSKEPLDIEKVKKNFQKVFAKTYLLESENDELNKLVFTAGLTFYEIIILRAYIKYMQQIGFRYSQKYINETIAEYPGLSKKIIKYFKRKFNQEKIKFLDDLEEEILQDLDKVESLEKDQILNQLFLCIKATLRTNYYQLVKKKRKDYLSLKLESSKIPNLPMPRPMYEIFVYSARFMGIHLRSSAVSRGGLRWSDRREDLRTEVLGLMKAQRVKNAVIVPAGAKGGFVLNDALMEKQNINLEEQVVEAYKKFISGLLDITDNIVKGRRVHPKNVFCYDDYDCYLVVAADKGTGNFSDIANEIADSYKFWLGDAFASGGSTGYNHKDMGITARGAWESTKRHFIDLNINIEKDDFTVVAIGDMSGDVFGNGMLYSEHIKLVAAFDHRDIFIDPDPDPKKSFKERKRLFGLKRSSWQDYDLKKLSKGGEIYSRKTKRIKISPAIQKCLDIKDKLLTPDELVKAILKAPVDLLYNGGIGTYIKATEETDDKVGDRVNDFCRVNGGQVRSKVIAEGGNLGITQLGRIEYAMNGGDVFTDFIDNSGGVDCSDCEVNIKILLNQVMQEKKLTLENRNKLLQSMGQEVIDLVLRGNHSQALAISLSASRVSHYAGFYQEYIRELEVCAELNRSVEYIPADKKIIERKTAEQGITPPEIAVLLGYTKIYAKNEILKSTLPEDPYMVNILENAFPKTLVKKFPAQLQKHKLRREIIATELSNKIIDEMGVSYVFRVKSETGATASEIIRAYLISTNVFGTYNIEKIITDLDFKVDAKLQYELLHHVRHLLNLSTRWFLRSGYLNNNIDDTIKRFIKPLHKLLPMLADLMSGATKVYLDNLIDHFEVAGIERKTAEKLATYRAIYVFLNVIDLSERYKFDLVLTAKLYFHVGARFNLVWFRDQLATDKREDHWTNMARLRLRDELDIIQRALTVIIMQSSKVRKNPVEMTEDWITNHPRPTQRWDVMIQKIHAKPVVDYITFFIALRELFDWLKAEDSLNKSKCFD